MYFYHHPTEPSLLSYQVPIPWMKDTTCSLGSTKQAWTKKENQDSHMSLILYGWCPWEHVLGVAGASGKNSTLHEEGKYQMVISYVKQKSS
jgi:hypothetical protein